VLLKAIVDRAQHEHHSAAVRQITSARVLNVLIHNVDCTTNRGLFAGQRLAIPREFRDVDWFAHREHQEVAKSEDTLAHACERLCTGKLETESSRLRECLLEGAEPTYAFF
jgi:hypothetical protein